MLSSSPIFCCSKYNAASLSWQMCETMALNSLKDNINCTSNFWFETFYLLYYILWYFNIVHKYGVLNMLLKYCYHQHCINFNHTRLAIAVLFARLYQNPYSFEEKKFAFHKFRNVMILRILWITRICLHIPKAVTLK